MLHVYSPADSAEAHMLVHLLEQSDIRAFVQGALLAGAVGGIPANDLLRIMVADEHAEKARALILAWEKQQPVRQESVSTAKPISSLTMLGIVVVSTLLGWVANDLLPLPTKAHENHPDKIDRNQDGKTDLIYQYLSSESAFAGASKADENFNGIFEFITEFDAKGIPYTGKQDMDEDGKYETIISYTDGAWSHSDTDTNNDGKADIFYDQIKRVRSVDDLKTGKPKIIEYYSPLGVLISADFDSDDDGILDTRYSYDRFNQITAREKIKKL
jgi:hypothetical protein